MKHNLVCLILVIYILPLMVAAQDVQPQDAFNRTHLLQVSGTSFFENYNSIDIGIMREMNSSSAIGMELGYIFNFFGFNQDQDEIDWFKNASGFKAYFQYRVYFNDIVEYMSNSRTFFEIEPGIFIMNYDSERIVGYQCNEDFGQCLYYRYFNSSVNRYAPRINFKLGKIYDFDPINITIFGGFGINHIIDVSDIPKSPEPDKYFFKNGRMNNDLSSGTNFNFRVGVQIGYRFH